MSYKPSRVAILREAVTKVTQILTGKSIKVNQRGISASVDYDRVTKLPIAVNLPMLPENASDELCDAIQGFLDHEVGHVLHTDPAALAKSKSLNKQAASIFNIVEDTFVERRQGEMFKGSASNLNTVGRFYLKHYTTPKLKEAQVKGDQNAELATLFPLMIRSLAGQFDFKEYLDKLGNPNVDAIMKKIEPARAAVQGVQSTEESLAVAQQIMKLLQQDSSGGGEGEDEDDSEGGEGEDDKKQGKSKGKQKQNKDKKPGEKKDKGDKQEKGEGKDKSDEKGKKDKGDPSEGDEEQEGEGQGGEGEGEESEEAGDQSGGQGEGDPSDEQGESGQDGEGGDQEGEASDTPQRMSNSLENNPVPEESSAGDGSPADLSWEEIASAIDGAGDYDAAVADVMGDMAVKAGKNADYLVYTTEYDVIEPLKVPAHSRDSNIQSCVKMVEEPVSSMVGPMQKELERAIAARSASTYVGGFRSGRLNSSALTRLKFNDDRVFRRKTENDTKDVAVELVVDISGSMSGSKVLTAAQAAFALAQVLDRLRIKSEVICFTTGGQVVDYAEQEKARSKGILYARTESLIMPILKGFDETVNSEVRARFGAMPRNMPMASNIDGECVEIAARRLMQRKASRHVMIVLSDGQPAGHTMCDRGVLIDDLKRRARKIERGGIDLVGIGIESDAVRSYYTKNIVINRVSELPTTVMRQLRDLLIPK